MQPIITIENYLDFNYKHIKMLLDNPIIDKKYLQIMMHHLSGVYFPTNTKNTSINYICWVDQSGKEILRINNKYKAPNNYYYELKV